MTGANDNGRAPATLDDVVAEVQRLRAEVRVLSSRLPTLVTVEEAARIFDVSPRTVRRRIKSREWPHVKVGTQVRVDLTQVRPGTTS